MDQMIEIEDDRDGDWQKATASQGNGNCVEVSFRGNGTVHVRDSKDPEGAHLIFSDPEWDAFRAGMAEGEFIRP